MLRLGKSSFSCNAQEYCTVNVEEKVFEYKNFISMCFPSGRGMPVVTTRSGGVEAMHVLLLTSREVDRLEVRLNRLGIIKTIPCEE